MADVAGSSWGFPPPSLARLLAAGVAALLALLCTHPARSDAHKRGAEVCSGRRARRVIRRRRRHAPGAFALAGVPITPQEETQHFKLLGTTGTGKSTAIAALL